MQRANPRDPKQEASAALPWILRGGVAMCFIGHGSYGLMTKAAWLPYFGVAGIGEPAAWKLMPWVGAMDIAVACLAFVWPCRALFLWAATWAIWTALLRPFAGQGWPEFFERAGNYGVPLAILAMVGLRGGWFARLPEPWPPLSGATRRRLAWTLRLAAFALLAGHAGCALLLQKPGLAQHYAVFGPDDPVRVMNWVGYLEAGLAVAVLAVPSPALLVGVCAWKFGTECLFLTSGATAPFFEVVERGGSYVVPFALACLLWEECRRSPVARVPQFAQSP
ncbi:MAG TPA: hypothetical protein VG734_05985 [Lacunisphaera sp.]|nr:hypothetical protein [Lacunisphaera sp.]